MSLFWCFGCVLRMDYRERIHGINQACVSKNVLTEANCYTDQPPPLKKKNRRRKKPVHHENNLFGHMKISANNKEVVSFQHSFQRILFGTNFNLLITYRLMRTLTKNFFTLSRLSLSQRKIVRNWQQLVQVRGSMLLRTKMNQ